MRYWSIVCYFFIGLSCGQSNTSATMSNQNRVRIAYQKHENQLHQLLTKKGIPSDSFDIHLRAYKAEALLEVWGKDKAHSVWTLLVEFPFCTNSGGPGPKRKEGDRQIPEGFYHIDRFNPQSKFHLSLGINYPNDSDLILSDKERPGSDIFIHGGCKSVGCIAITDEKIEALYVLADEARKLDQLKIPVRIFPCKMEASSLIKLINNNPVHQAFWKTLMEEDQYFNKTKELMTFSILTNGAYVLN